MPSCFVIQLNDVLPNKRLCVSRRDSATGNISTMASRRDCHRRVWQQRWTQWVDVTIDVFDRPNSTVIVLQDLGLYLSRRQASGRMGEW